MIKEIITQKTNLLWETNTSDYKRYVSIKFAFIKFIHLITSIKIKKIFVYWYNNHNLLNTFLLMNNML